MFYVQNVAERHTYMRMKLKNTASVVRTTLHMEALCSCFYIHVYIHRIHNYKTVSLGY